MYTINAIWILDPDMLEVGNGGMTTEEYRAHFSIWALAKVHKTVFRYLLLTMQYINISLLFNYFSWV